MANSLSPVADVPQLWDEYKKDLNNRELRNRLVEQYLPLVRYHGERVWSRLPQGVDLDDLISAGVFGLMDAIDAFDLERGGQIRNLLRAAHPRGHARRASQHRLGARDSSVRVPESSPKPPRCWKTSTAAGPTEQELAGHMGITLTEVEKMMLDAKAVTLVSLNKKWSETDGAKEVGEIDILEDPRARIRRGAFRKTI